MILFASLRVVVDEFLDVGLDESDLGEDFVGGRGPGEGFGVGIPVVDVVTDLADQNLDAAEGAATDRLAGDNFEQCFYPIFSRKPYRGEIKRSLKTVSESFPHPRS